MFIDVKCKRKQFDFNFFYRILPFHLPLSRLSNSSQIIIDNSTNYIISSHPMPPHFFVVIILFSYTFFFSQIIERLFWLLLQISDEEKNTKFGMKWKRAKLLFLCSSISFDTLIWRLDIVELWCWGNKMKKKKNIFISIIILHGSCFIVWMEEIENLILKSKKTR